MGRPNVGSREDFLDAVGKIFDSRWFTNHGPMERRFEEELRSITGTRHCIPVANASIGLEVAAKALGLSGEVIVPGFTFVATAHTLRWLGLTPVFADVDPVTHNIDPASAERMVTPRTSAILGVHLWGRPCDVDALENLCRQRDLSLFFDAAHAFGCSHEGRMIGNFGRCEVFSFHATKFLNSFEGGAIATNEDELARRIRLMTNFGFTGYDRVESEGSNGKMTEVCAAMGLASLASMEGILRKNQANLARYAEGLAGIPGIRLLPYSTQERCNHHYVIIEVEPSDAGIERDRLLEILHAENILARRYFHPGVHRMSPYVEEQPTRTLPHTEWLAARTLALPNGQAIEDESIDAICGCIRFVVNSSSRLPPAVRGTSRP